MGIAPGAAAELASRGIDGGLGIGPVALRYQGAERGLGLVASRDVQASQPLLRLPRRLWLPVSAEGARAAATASVPGFVKQIDNVAEAILAGRSEGVTGGANIGASIVLSLHLVFEVHSSAAPVPAGDNDPLSAWARSYWRFMPKSLSVPLLWQRDRLMELQASPVLKSTAARQEYTAAIYDAVFPPTEVDAEGRRLAPAQLPEYAWAQSLLLSRAAAGADRPFSMLPVVDCLNHRAITLQPGLAPPPLLADDDEAARGAWVRSACVDNPVLLGGDHGVVTPEGAASLDYDADSESFVVSAAADAAQGTELLISYGRLCNSELVPKYGFALLDNADNTVPLMVNWEAVQRGVWCTPGTESVRRELQRRVMSRSDSINLRGSGKSSGRGSGGGGGGAADVELPKALRIFARAPLPAQLLALFRASVLCDEDVESGAAHAWDYRDPRSRVSPRNEREAMLAIERECMAALADYEESSLEEDMKLLSAHYAARGAGSVGGDGGGGGVLPPWLHTCVVLRAGEKRVLADAVAGARAIRDNL